MPVGCIPEKTIRGDFDLVRISRVEGSRCVYATSVLPVQRFRRCRRDALRGNRPKLQLQLGESRASDDSTRGGRVVGGKTAEWGIVNRLGG